MLPGTPRKITSSRRRDRALIGFPCYCPCHCGFLWVGYACCDSLHRGKK